MGPIVASSANPHYLSLYWNTLSGHFDGFVVQVSDSEQQSDTLEFRLPGEARNITIPNLMDDTGYDIEVYGISHGRRTPSMFVHAVTGTTYFTDIHYFKNFSKVWLNPKMHSEPNGHASPAAVYFFLYVDAVFRCHLPPL